jgi:hypothetical protein
MKGRGELGPPAIAPGAGKGIRRHPLCLRSPELDGEDLRSLTWDERRLRLEQLLKRATPGIHLSEHAEGDGEALFRQGCTMGLEGLWRSAGDRGTARARAATGSK